MCVKGGSGRVGGGPGLGGGRGLEMDIARVSAYAMRSSVAAASSSAVWPSESISKFDTSRVQKANKGRKKKILLS